jgi:hypothetical protein
MEFGRMSGAQTAQGSVAVLNCAIDTIRFAFCQAVKANIGLVPMVLPEVVRDTCLRLTRPRSQPANPVAAATRPILACVICDMAHLHC